MSVSDSFQCLCYKSRTIVYFLYYYSAGIDFRRQNLTSAGQASKTMVLY